MLCTSGTAGVEACLENAGACQPGLTLPGMTTPGISLRCHCPLERFDQQSQIIARFLDAFTGAGESLLPRCARFAVRLQLSVCDHVSQ